MSRSASATGTRRLRHYPRCYGCGTANDAGLQLSVDWDGHQAVLELAPPAAAEGGPGIVHGGWLAALADEVMALVACEYGGGPAMTRRIELDLRAPTLVGEPLRVRSWVADSGRRRIVVRLSAARPGAERASFEARALFLRVSRDTWLRAMNATGRSPDRLDWGRGDPSTFFRWQMDGGLRHVFVPDRLARPVRVALVLADVEPAVWTIVATRSRLDTHPDAADGWDARFVGTFRQWQQVIRGAGVPRPSGSAGRVEGDLTALAALVAAFDFRR